MVTGIDGLDELACRDACRKEPSCKWFTFQDNSCDLFETCTSIDSDLCLNCFIGQEVCSLDSVQGKEQSLLFVIGGERYSDNIYFNNIEIFDLSESQPRCKSIAPYPVEATGILSAFAGKLIGCGGSTLFDSYGECFVYDKDANVWNEVKSLPGRNYVGTKSSIIDGKWFISGGVSSRLSTLIFDNGEFVEGPPLPHPKHGHCQVTLNDTHIFFSGGTSVTTFLLDLPNKKWITLKSSPGQYYYPGCGLVNSPTFGQEVVMTTLEFTAIFSLSTLEWNMGKSLPEKVDSMTSAQFENDFVVIGGRKSDGLSISSMYRFDANSYDWVKINHDLEEPRDLASAVAAPKSYITCT